MQVQPKAGPVVLDPARPQGQTQKDQDRKARAMSALGFGAAQGNSIPVGNASATTPIEHVSMQAAANTQQPKQSVVDDRTPSASPVETKASTPEENPLSQHYAILARKEKALRARVQQQEQTLRHKEAAIKAQEDALKARDAEYASKYIAKDRLAEDPLAVLNDSGLSYEKLTELMLNPGNSHENLELKRYQAKVEGELKYLREQQERSVKAQEEATSNQYKQALTQIHYDVKATIDSDPEFETIKATGSSGDVVQLIERVYKREGILLTVEEACKEVEDYLMEEAEKIFRINKLSKKFQQAASAPAPIAKPSQSEQQPPQMKTLTNSVSSTRKMTRAERAVLAFQGKLK